MMHIDAVNPIVENSVVQYLRKGMNEVEHYNDFENIMYKFMGEGDYFLFGFSTPGFKDVMANGGKEMLEEKYGRYLGPGIPKLDGCDITLGVKRSELPKRNKVPASASPEEKEKMRAENKEIDSKKKQIVKGIAREFSLIKKNFFGAPIERALKELLAKGTVSDSAGCEIKYRPTEQYWVIPNQSNVIITFALDFKDPVDQGLARILLLEFHESKSHLRSMKNPPDSKYYDLTVPLGLEKYNPDLKKYSNGFLAFSVFKSNVEGRGLDRVVEFLAGFREYAQYHIHATKAYLHTRMRKKISEFLKLIQDAKREKSERRKKYKELIGGSIRNIEEEDTDITQTEVFKFKKSK